jgi:hypothetical protein
MKNIIIIILLILIGLLLIDNENFGINNGIPKAFTPIDLNTRIYFDQPNVTTTSIYQNRFNLFPTTIGDKVSNDQPLFTKELTSKNCCLVEKKTFDGTQMIDNTQNQYKYTKYANDDCDLNNFNLNENNQLFFDGVNDWSNSYCSADTNNLGSCQHYDMECIDFVSEQKCQEYNNKMPPDPQKRKITYNWNPKTCYAIK